jgi:hypothetical protein
MDALMDSLGIQKIPTHGEKAAVHGGWLRARRRDPACLAQQMRLTRRRPVDLHGLLE